MKIVNMLFNNKLPTKSIYYISNLQVIDQKKNSKLDTQQKISYQHYIHQISSSPALHTFQHPYIQERRKIDT